MRPFAISLGWPKVTLVKGSGFSQSCEEILGRPLSLEHFWSRAYLLLNMYGLKILRQRVGLSTFDVAHLQNSQLATRTPYQAQPMQPQSCKYACTFQKTYGPAE